MTLVDEVRRALQPLIDNGVVVDLQEEGRAVYGDGLVPQQQVFRVIVDAPASETYGPEVNRLILGAGLTDRVRAVLHPKERT